MNVMVIIVINNEALLQYSPTTSLLIADDQNLVNYVRRYAHLCRRSFASRVGYGILNHSPIALVNK